VNASSQTEPGPGTSKRPARPREIRAYCLSGYVADVLPPDVLGRPHLELQHDMKLWWVHNEAALAALYGYHLTGGGELLEWYQRVEKWSWGHFPDPQYVEWFAYLDRRRVPTHGLKGGKWKCFFHLPRYLLTGIELCDKILAAE
jgi:hypothetical protein